jgi:cupin fold WbuC family metalloprotein
MIFRQPAACWPDDSSPTVHRIRQGEIRIVIIINRQLVSSVSEEAKKSARLRKNLNFHADLADPVNRMLNAFEPGTYVRPHKHESPDKCEVFLILTGKALALRFNDAGAIIDHVILDSAQGIYGVEFPPREWHTIVALAPETVLYEVKPGPYTPINDKNFASWAPSEGSPEAAAYLQSILTGLALG